MNYSKPNLINNLDNALSFEEIGFYVYQLRVEGSETPFYIGKGKGQRVNIHFTPSDLSSKTHKSNKILKCLREGLEVHREIVAHSLLESDALLLEAELIRRYGRACDGSGVLTNMTEGGEGTSGHRYTEEHKEHLRSIHKERCSKQEVRDAMSEVGKVRWSDNSLRESMSEVKKLYHANNPEAAVKQSAAIKKLYEEDPSLRHIKSEAMKASWESGERKPRSPNKQHKHLLEYKGVSYSVSKFAKLLGMGVESIYYRMNKGMTPEQIAASPFVKSVKRKPLPQAE